MDDDFALFFGRTGERLAREHAQGQWTFCWPGFLFPQAWFLYRKMYGWAALVTAGPFVLERLPGLGGLAWGGSILGALGLKLYFRSAGRIVAAIRADSADEAEARERIARAGGVSRFGAWVGALFTFAAVISMLKAGAW